MEGVVMAMLDVKVFVEGTRGAGKTTVLNLIRHALIAAGYEVSHSSFSFGKELGRDTESVLVRKPASAFPVDNPIVLQG